MSFKKPLVFYSLILIWVICSIDTLAVTGITGNITVKVANFRAAPSQEAVILDQLTRGTTLEIMKIEGDWGWVRLKDQREGWVSKKCFSVNSNSSRSRLPDHLTRITDSAQKYLEVPYHYGGASTNGFDCSGFTMFVYAQFGYDLPHNAAAQMNVGKFVSRNELRPGDLVFFKTLGSAIINHVGIYLGSEEFIHASSGYGAIRISPLNTGYYNVRFQGGRRIIDDSNDTVFNDESS